MDSSATDLRLLMKKHTLLKSGSSDSIVQTKLTGKEKLFLLKQQQQQQQQKTQHNFNASKHQQQLSTGYDANNNSVRHSSTHLSKPPDQIILNLPSKFFDDDNNSGDHSSKSLVISTSNEAKKNGVATNNHNLVSTNLMNNAEEHQQSITLSIHSTSSLPVVSSLMTTSSTSTSTSTVVVPKKRDDSKSSNAVLPMGFFDNPIEDLNAHGMTIVDYRNKVDKEEKQEFDQFLSEVKAIEPTSEELDRIEYEEALVNEYEDEAKQISYYAKLMMLQSQSSQIHPSVKKLMNDCSTAIQHTSTLCEEAEEASKTHQLLHTILRETTMLNDDAIVDGEASLPGASVDIDMYDDKRKESGIEGILYDKLQVRLSKKRRIIQNKQEVFKLCRVGNDNGDDDDGDDDDADSSRSRSRIHNDDLRPSEGKDSRVRYSQQNCEDNNNNNDDDEGEERKGGDDDNDDNDDDNDSVVEYTPFNFLS